MLRQMALRLYLLTFAALVALTLAPAAFARGGNIQFDGGTAYQRTQVREALSISSFDWSVVPTRVTVHIAHGIESEATPGQIWLDAGLLDAGRFSWGVVQHEYAHQVDFSLFTDAIRARVQTQLGGKTWCNFTAGLAHADYGCERFASTLAWAYWPSADNCMRPQSKRDESGGMTPVAFRALLASVLEKPALRRLTVRA